MTPEHWLLFSATEFMAYLVPGPAVMFIVSQAMACGTRGSLWSMLGILLTEVMYFILSAMGLGIILVNSHILFLVIKWAGAAYLVWIGVQTIRGSGKAFKIAPGRSPSMAHSRQATMRGFITNSAIRKHSWSMWPSCRNSSILSCRPVRSCLWE